MTTIENIKAKIKEAKRLEVIKIKLKERIEKERIKSTEKFKNWCNNGYRGYRSPDFDKKLDELRSRLEVVEAKLLSINH